jgi:hypothetical protein
MGLDMYLIGKKFLWTSFDDKSECKRTLVSDLFPDIEAQASHVHFEVGYWRKANAIHLWFVTVVQNGTDDCGEYIVTKENLLALQALCKKALAGSHEVLPTTSGFFFGSTDYDEWYIQDLEHALKIIDRAMLFIKDHGEVYYQSSW